MESRSHWKNNMSTKAFHRIVLLTRLHSLALLSLICDDAVQVRGSCHRVSVFHRQRNSTLKIAFVSVLRLRPSQSFCDHMINFNLIFYSYYNVFSLSLFIDVCFLSLLQHLKVTLIPLKIFSFTYFYISFFLFFFSLNSSQLANKLKFKSLNRFIRTEAHQL